MIYAKVTKKGQKKVKKAVGKAQELKWYRRLKIIQLSSQGYGVPELAEMFDLSQATVRIYLKGYNNTGLKGLAPTTGADDRPA